MQRKSAILVAASHHFSHHGYRGASLRDIARDAGVSLTLLNHHFGSKLQLLAAVVDHRLPMLDAQSAALNLLMQAGPGNYTLEEVLDLWIRIAFERAADPEAETFLRLASRVIDDPSEEGLEVVRERLDDGALVFIDALQQCFPGASRYAAASVYVYVSATLTKFLIASRRLFRLARAGAPRDPDSEDRARLARFLAAGIVAALGDDTPPAGLVIAAYPLASE